MIALRCCLPSIHGYFRPKPRMTCKQTERPHQKTIHEHPHRQHTVEALLPASVETRHEKHLAHSGPETIWSESCLNQELSRLPFPKW